MTDTPLARFGLSISSPPALIRPSAPFFTAAALLPTVRSRIAAARLLQRVFHRVLHRVSVESDVTPVG
eukprot:5849333-Pyramimonas_sp.AAC.1